MSPLTAIERGAQAVRGLRLAVRLERGRRAREIALEVRVDGRVGLLTLDRPSKLNAISATMVAELTAAAAWFALRQP